MTDTIKVPQVPPVSKFGMNFADFPVTFHLDSTDRLSTGKRKPEPRPHQIEAIENVISGFQTANRGQLIMPCATGKTLICLWVKEKLKAKRTLVLVPSLGLLSQILSDWTAAARQQFDVLCVCSDETVSKKDDEPLNVVADLPFPVSNDVSGITDFLRRNNDQVIFSTYQSSPLIAQAQKNVDVAHFDLAVADEAHRCAGKMDSVFGTILDAELIKSDRRLFATATPRIYTTRVKKKAGTHDVEVVDMRDEKLFGPRFHTLSFSKAIKDKLLTDYRVVVVGVDDERIKKWIEKRRLVEIDTGLPTDAKSLATQIGLLKAIKDWNLHKIISFHGRVKRAKEFSEDIGQVAVWLNDEYRPGANLHADYVSGEMATNFRTQKLERLKNIGSGEIGLLSNARCLSEGIDVPALDGIAFIDPKGSEIDIIQSVGRAATSVGEDFAQSFRTHLVEKTTESWMFWYGLLETFAKKYGDCRVSQDYKTDDGYRLGSWVSTQRQTKDTMDPNRRQRLEALPGWSWDPFSDQWEEGFSYLKKYLKREKHCRVPYDFKTDDGFRLGAWATKQRQAKDKMNLDRRQRLEALSGWSWDVRSDNWQEGFSYLKEFAEREGHCRVPDGFKTDTGYPLQNWVETQRLITKDSDRRQRLEALSGWSWDVRSDNWQEGFSYLKEFAEREGHCRVPDGFKTNDGFRLGQWVRVQRTNKDKMDSDRRQRLEALPRWSWGPYSDQWEDGFSYLKEFAEREGHCRVPATYKTDDGYRLGSWVYNQRRAKDKMDPNRLQRLAALPDWSWQGKRKAAAF